MASGAKFRWDDDLSGSGRCIAELDHSPIRVLAGPGTGKTFALMRRIARLIQNGSSPDKMLVCTFTRTAARDLESELARLGIEGVESVRAGTLHSLCFGLLGQSEVLEITGRAPRPLLSFEERFLLEDLNGKGFGGVRERVRRLQAFNAAWARLQSEIPGWPLDCLDQEFQRALLGWLRFHKAILIGELVPETLRFLRDNPASVHRTAFDHLLVDEYQDLNRAEQMLLDLLAESGKLIVIGDEDQSIYSFKFAHPEGIRDFDQSHVGTHDESLDECRRCPHRVVEMANALIANNTARDQRALRPLAGSPEGEVLVLQWPTIEEEARGIAQLIQSRIQRRKIAAGKVLVLAPRRHFGYAVRDALNKLGVPAHSFFHEEAFDGDPKRLEESDAQQTFSLLTLLADPEDRVALRCWCGFGSNSLRSGAWTRLRDYCQETGDSPRVILERLASGILSLPHTRDLVKRFRELQLRHSELASLRGNALLDELFPANQDWTEFIRTLSETIEEDDFDTTILREALRVGITQPELPTDVDYVRVMSLHKSKGLTADLVVVVGCIEGLIPMVTGESIPEQRASLEEQRRLFYVAITRTRRVLVLSSVTSIPRELAYRMRVQVRGGNRTIARTIASRFLSELGPACPNGTLGTTIPTE